MDDRSSANSPNAPPSTSAPDHAGAPAETTSNKLQPPQSPATGPAHTPVSNRANSSSDARHGRTEEHERIARDLDDTLVHQIFAVSLDLSAALAHIDDHRAAEKILHAINGLDQAIKDLREAVFESSATGIPRASSLRLDQTT